MPYIQQNERDKLFARWTGIKTPGELNYVVTEIVKRYFHDNGGRYQQINDILGAFEGAKLEFYRRVAAPYEDAKIKENGDVYP